jgi:hypothetical protein
VEPLDSSDPQSVGPYRLLGRLGAGGMGLVYLGRTGGGRTVAVKVIRAELAGDGEFRERFRHEVNAARAVAGTYTVPVVDADPEAANPWLATSYVLGPALNDAIHEHGPLPEQGVRALGAGLAEALIAIHAAGLAHRDLKPGNVLLAPDGPRVIDFGIARAMDSAKLTSTGLIIGSPGYMSPEQASGQPTGPAGDVFSLASVLAFAATGRGPFGDSASAVGLLYQVVHGAPDLTGLSPELIAVLEPCFAKDPARRPTPAQLGAALERDGAEAALARDWLPLSVASAIARHAGTVVDLDLPDLPPGMVPVADGGTIRLKSGGTGASADPRSQWGQNTPAQQAQQPQQMQLQQPQMQQQGVSEAPTVPMGDGAGSAAGSASRRKLLTGVLSAAGVVVVGGGVAFALDGGSKKKPTPDNSPAATGASSNGPSPTATRAPNVPPTAQWTFAGQGLSTVPTTVIDGIVLVAGGAITGVNLQTGKQAWVSPALDTMDTAPAVGRIGVSGTKPIVLALDQLSRLTAFNTVTGTNDGTIGTPAGVQYNSIMGADATEVYLNANVYPNPNDFTNQRSALIAVNITADQAATAKWTQLRDKGTTSDLMGEIVGGVLLYLDDLGDFFTARDTATGNELWSQAPSKLLSSQPTGCAANGLAYLPGPTLTAVRLKTGTKVWSLNQGSNYYYGTPGMTPDGKTLFTTVNATLSLQVIAVDGNSGTVLWTSALPDNADGSATPTVCNNLVFWPLQSDPQGFVAMDTATGKVMWTYTDGQTISSTGSPWQLTAVPSSNTLIAVHGNNVYALPRD